MGYIGNTAENFETIEDRKTYTADGTTTQFGVLFSDSNVSVFQNGVKLKETDDYTVDTAGTYHGIFNWNNDSLFNFCLCKISYE